MGDQKSRMGRPVPGTAMAQASKRNGSDRAALPVDVRISPLVDVISRGSSTTRRS